MKSLMNLTPGRSIRDPFGTWWRVDALEGDDILLSRCNNQVKGRLRASSINRCTLYPTHEEIEQRYPRLVRSMSWGAGLSHDEAISAVIDYLVNGPFSKCCEAVANFGGAAAVIGQAIRSRHVVRRVHVQTLVLS